MRELPLPEVRKMRKWMSATLGALIIACGGGQSGLESPNPLQSYTPQETLQETPPVPETPQTPSEPSPETPSQVNQQETVQEPPPEPALKEKVITVRVNVRNAPSKALYVSPVRILEGQPIPVRVDVAELKNGSAEVALKLPGEYGFLLVDEKGFAVAVLMKGNTPALAKIETQDLKEITLSVDGCSAKYCSMSLEGFETVPLPQTALEDLDGNGTYDFLEVIPGNVLAINTYEICKDGLPECEFLHSANLIWTDFYYTVEKVYEVPEAATLWPGGFILLNADRPGILLDSTDVYNFIPSGELACYGVEKYGPFIRAIEFLPIYAYPHEKVYFPVENVNLEEEYMFYESYAKAAGEWSKKLKEKFGIRGFRFYGVYPEGIAVPFLPVPTTDPPKFVGGNARVVVPRAPILITGLSPSISKTYLLITYTTPSPDHVCNRNVCIGISPFHISFWIDIEYATLWQENLTIDHALHELGHVLGLLHSDHPESIMGYSITPLTTVGEVDLKTLEPRYKVALSLEFPYVLKHEDEARYILYNRACAEIVPELEWPY